MSVKKQPVRMCAACREGRPKRRLIRVVRNKEGAVSVDLTSKAAGRGAYICADRACLERAKKTRAISRALDAAVPEEIYAALEQVIAERENEADCGGQDHR